MELHLVNYFVAVVDHGSVTAAARSLYITQPSLSQAIRTLERNLGSPLFERVGRRLVLTPAGRDFDAAARRLLADLGAARDKVDAVRELRAGSLELVTYSTFAIDPTVDLVRRFRERHPRITVTIFDTAGPEGVFTALRQGRAEVGISSLVGDHSPLHAVSLGEQELMLALPEALAATLPDPVSREAVRSVPLIVDLGSVPGNGVTPDLLAENAENVVVDSTRPSLTWDLVRLGAGATIVSRAVAASQLPAVTVRSVDPPLTQTVALLTRKPPLSPAAEAFLQLAGAQDWGE
ncbi:LysR family transcriptional regulator [Rhodococcus tukisamuensis]|uniref:DNA-binding transcriptional regulator, LysR family n=1 Tax=Rhodococcus tukisamuensis TaxID=168276 RepID=A0A1G6WB48_9NOCA|nr:LysR family transcriptional regulator [Rhodococcus tukisamuensis]SDD62276.1 DNA-binding transcriptional regulator, LysR family [Rhodococcus tukisamuensis]